jgi:hypothetical protein
MVSTSVEYDKDGKEIARWMWCSGNPCGGRQWLRKVADNVYSCPECGTIKNLKYVNQLG